ncbi:MAG: NAD(P)/FAD-dependent oxidoreductase [Bacteroidota bacterium]
MQQAKTVDTVIVGSGFSGLCLAIRLKTAGYGDLVILEAAAELGGTWRDNTYPGCACDIPSHLYCFSFFPNPDWSRKYSGHAEIQAYLKACAKHFGLGPHFRFNRRVDTAVWDEGAGRWEVRTRSGEVYRARFLATGTGGLSQPNIPEIAGKADFAGPKFHSQRWDHRVELRGKRLAIIGTGASAVQIVPAVVDQVAQLNLFQRTPPWVLPRQDRAYRPAEKRRFRKWEAWRRLYRHWLYWKAEARFLGFRDLKFVGRLAEGIGRRHLRRSIPDVDLQRALTPDYRLGCKRGLLSDDYYPALARENAGLVTSGIDRITAEGILTQDGKHHPADVLVFATGFKAVEYLSQIRIVGRSGRVLNEAWADSGGEAYLGTTVHGFPNLFLLTGPNSGLGHNSLIHIIESQANYVLDAVRQLPVEGDWAEVRAEIQADYNQKIQAQLARTVWQMGGCRSWYQMESGKNTALLPTWTFVYRRQTNHFRATDYRVESR